VIREIRVIVVQPVDTSRNAIRIKCNRDGNSYSTQRKKHSTKEKDALTKGALDAANSSLVEGTVLPG
jgi:hypothetical protein